MHHISTLALLTLFVSMILCASAKCESLLKWVVYNLNPGVQMQQIKTNRWSLDSSIE